MYSHSLCYTVPQYKIHLSAQYYSLLFPNKLIANKSLWFVICGGVQLIIREVIQIFSLVSVGHFSTWWKSKTNYADVICNGIMFLWPLLMLSGVVNKDSDPAIKEAFQGSLALAAGFLFLLMFSFFKKSLWNSLFSCEACVLFSFDY